ncbi:hypothetical protein ColLi_00449 [Colletotrichum liriopes]|uniref:Uncharacterized protein n=1 Tax=Colletotrichum liriopes TaxID=708192 RepID=A0AA37GB18_9PEZI|nr:hypothetical protein ColLi_00449 [Colletotrichum liriopes]
MDGERGAMIRVHMPRSGLAMNQLLLALDEEPAGFRTVACRPPSALHREPRACMCIQGCPMHSGMGDLFSGSRAR